MKRATFPPVIPLTSHTKAEAYAEASRYAKQGMSGMWIIQILHDDFCKVVKTQNDADCHPKCKPAFVLMRSDMHADFMRLDARLRKAGVN